MKLSAPEILLHAVHAQGDGQQDGRMTGAAASCAVTDLHDYRNIDPQQLLTAFVQLLPGSLTADGDCCQGQRLFGAIGEIIHTERLGDAPLESTADGYVSRNQVP